MRKEVGWKWENSIGLSLSYSRWDFQTNQCRPHPLRGIKLLSEPCFYYLKSMIVSQYRYSFGGLEKIRETCMPRGEFKHRYCSSLPKLQISLAAIALFEKIYDGKRFLPSSQITGRMYNSVVSIKCMMLKVCRSPTLCRYLQTIIEFKWQK